MSDSAQPNPEQAPEQTNNNAPEQSFTKDDVQKIIDEAKKYKSMVSDFENKLKAKEIEDLTKNQKWQELAELNEKMANDAIQEREKYKSAFANKEKMSALREAALQSGIRKESIPDLRLIDFPEIRLEANSEGEFTASGADKAIQRLKTLRPHWFQNAAPSVNSSSPVVTGDGGQLTADAVMKLQSEYNKNPNAANADKLKGAIFQFKKQAAK